VQKFGIEKDVSEDIELKDLKGQVIDFKPPQTEIHVYEDDATDWVTADGELYSEYRRDEKAQKLIDTINTDKNAEQEASKKEPLSDEIKPIRIDPANHPFLTAEPDQDGHYQDSSMYYGNTHTAGKDNEQLKKELQAVLFDLEPPKGRAEEQVIESHIYFSGGN